MNAVMRRTHQFRIVRPEPEVEPEGMVITILRPGRYRIALPTEGQAAQLEMDRPSGLLNQVGSQLLWVEPVESLV